MRSYSIKRSVCFICNIFIVITKWPSIIICVSICIHHFRDMDISCNFNRFSQLTLFIFTSHKLHLILFYVGIECRKQKSWPLLFHWNSHFLVKNCVTRNAFSSSIIYDQRDIFKTMFFSMQQPKNHSANSPSSFSFPLETVHCTLFGKGGKYFYFFSILKCLLLVNMWQIWKYS